MADGTLGARLRFRPRPAAAPPAAAFEPGRDEPLGLAAGRDGVLFVPDTAEPGGPVLVFLHGIVANGALWRRVVPGLADQYRCITPDWPLGSHEVPPNPDADLTPPGLGRLIADFLEALDLRDVTVVSNDTGTALNQILATTHPER
ncbi:MAG TPA: alpha/beta fold hydrolase, partial [Acidimicrobiales bacterium]